MNKFSFYILPGLLLCNFIAAAQGLKIMPSTTFKSVGGPLDIVLSGATSLENNVAIQSTDLIVKATGTGTSQIKGTGTLGVGQILMNKSTGQFLSLTKDVTVAGGVTFTSGLLNINGNTLSLIDTALLVNESETSRITASTGGNVQVQANLNAPLAENPGNLGLVITSGADWGNTVIKRGNSAFTAPGGGSSISRSYVVQPTNNSSLNAFLRVYYKDAELNGLDENTLTFFQSTDNGANWTDIGAASRNTTQNFVNINGVQNVSLLTLSTINNPLPLLFTDVTASCDHNMATLQWRVGVPSNIASFRIMKSSDAKVWESVATSIEVMPDASHLYSFTDSKNPSPFYRLESVGHDGLVTYAPVQKVNCSEENFSFNLMQNPIQNTLAIGISAKRNEAMDIQIFDLQGRHMISQSLKLTPGTTTATIDAGQLASGIYNIRVSNQNEIFWQAKFVKQ
jgi:hypothetical protein